MIAKYHIEYGMAFKQHAQASHYQTDDPVAAQAFLLELLERGFLIKVIKHDGVELPRHDADKLIKTAAGMLAAKHVCVSLGIKPEEAHYRFGFTA